MKHKIILLLFMAVSFSAFSQNGVTLYGFYQESLPGTIPKGTDENGNTIPKKSAVDYIIYLKAPASSKITPVEIWIKGEQTLLQAEKTKTPVHIQSSGTGNSTTLVPKTGSNVWKIIPTSSTNYIKFTRARDKAEVNDVVVVYKLKGKFYSATLKNLKRLEPRNNE